MLNYSQLSQKQRYTIIAVFTLALLVISYYGVIIKMIDQIKQDENTFDNVKNQNNEQNKFLNDSNAVTKKIASTTKQLTQANLVLDKIWHKNHFKPTEILIVDANHIQIKKLMPWEKMIQMLAEFAASPIFWQVDKLELVQETNGVMIMILLSKESEPYGANQTNHISTNPFEQVQNKLLKSIEAKETQWLGVLNVENNWLAILKLPNQKVIGLKTGETFGESTWQVISIDAEKIILFESAIAKKMVIHVREFSTDESANTQGIS